MHSNLYIEMASKLYRIHLLSDYFLYLIGITFMLYWINPYAPHLFCVWKLYLLGYFWYQIIYEIVWTQESNTVSLCKLSEL